MQVGGVLAKFSAGWWSFVCRLVEFHLVLGRLVELSLILLHGHGLVALAKFKRLAGWWRNRIFRQVGGGSDYLTAVPAARCVAN